MSAQCNLVGLCPPSGLEIWKTGFNWQPIPIHTVPLDEDFILNPRSTCQRRDFLLDKYAAKIIDENRYLIDFLQVNSGFKNLTFESIVLLQDTLHVESLKGLTLVIFNWP